MIFRFFGSFVLDTGLLGSLSSCPHKGTFHKLSPKHLHRYVDEFVGRYNIRALDTIDQMAQIASKMDKSRLRYKDLVR